MISFRSVVTRQSALRMAASQNLSQNISQHLSHRRISVLLLKDEERVGRKGQIVNVADGYMRNFLYPSSAATYPTAENVEKFFICDAENDDQPVVKVSKSLRVKLRKRLQKLATATVLIKRHSPDNGGSLNGHVTSENIAAALLKQHNIRLDSSRITLPLSSGRVDAMPSKKGTLLVQFELSEEECAVLGNQPGVTHIDINVEVVKR